ncbi:MAG: hypothetical protein EBT44_04455 [Actinobacteria bacterium]|uniref:histidine kinase n=1 Tax=Candidatus Fonsibacter lacus TaxID=2576439 RepID=A0A965GDD4_9PROT|nr:hypothetical protein [Candidatus Fonsibacter lacus]
MQSRLKNFTNESVERLKIARDLHDTLAQELAAIGFACDEAIALSSMGPSRDSLVEVRSRISLLGTMVRDEIGLLRDGNQSFLKMFANFSLQIKVNNPIEISNQLASTFDLPSEIRLEVFRSVREILTNIVLHSHATSMEITSNLSNQNINLIISDNGIPFDSQSFSAQPTHHFGLLGARERIERLGGKLEYSRQDSLNLCQIVLP